MIHEGSPEMLPIVDLGAFAVPCNGVECVGGLCRPFFPMNIVRFLAGKV